MSLMPQWQALLGQPLAFVDRRHLRRCFAENVAGTQIQALIESPRFQARLQALMLAHFQLQPLDQVSHPTEQDLPVLLLAPQDFARLPRLCGAIWHGATLGREIRREVVEHLRQGLGHEVFGLAIAHRQWGGAMDLLRQPDDLLAAIDHDGARCVQAWFDEQPADLRDWLLLRLPLPVAEGSASLADPGIVRRVAALLMPLSENRESVQ